MPPALRLTSCLRLTSQNEVSCPAPAPLQAPHDLFTCPPHQPLSEGNRSRRHLPPEPVAPASRSHTSGHPSEAGTGSQASRWGYADGPCLSRGTSDSGKGPRQSKYSGALVQASGGLHGGDGRTGTPFRHCLPMRVTCAQPWVSTGTWRGSAVDVEGSQRWSPTEYVRWRPSGEAGVSAPGGGMTARGWRKFQRGGIFNKCLWHLLRAFPDAGGPPPVAGGRCAFSRPRTTVEENRLSGARRMGTLL